LRGGLPGNSEIVLSEAVLVRVIVTLPLPKPKPLPSLRLSIKAGQVHPEEG